MKRLSLLLLTILSFGCVTEPLPIESPNTTFTFYVESDYFYNDWYQNQEYFNAYYVIHNQDGKVLHYDEFEQGKLITYENPSLEPLKITFLTFTDWASWYSMNLFTYEDLGNGDWGLVKKNKDLELMEWNFTDSVSSISLKVKNVPSNYIHSFTNRFDVNFDEVNGGDWTATLDNYYSEDFFVVFKDKNGQAPSKYFLKQDIRSNQLGQVDFNQLPTTKRHEITIEDLEKANYTLVGEQNSPYNQLVLADMNNHQGDKIVLDLPHENIFDGYKLYGKLMHDGDWFDYKANFDDLPTIIQTSWMDFESSSYGLGHTTLAPVGDFDFYEADFYFQTGTMEHSIRWIVTGKNKDAIDLDLNYELPQEITDMHIAFGRIQSMDLYLLDFTNYMDKTPDESYQYWCNPFDNQAETSFSTQFLKTTY